MTSFHASMVKMRSLLTTIIALTGVILLCLALQGCGAPRDGADEHVTKLGSIEVTARLVEVPAEAIAKRDVYVYTGILKYEVLTIHRGQVPGKFIYVGHYNPPVPRYAAADQRVKEIGGDVASFQVGDAHRLALEVPLEEHYMGPIINPYFGQDTGPLYWSLWCNEVDQ